MIDLAIFSLELRSMCHCGMHGVAGILRCLSYLSGRGYDMLSRCWTAVGFHVTVAVAPVDHTNGHKLLMILLLMIMLLLMLFVSVTGSANVAAAH